MTERDLDFIPVRPLGHRKKMLKEISKLAKTPSRRHWASIKPLAEPECKTASSNQSVKSIADEALNEEEEM